MHAELLAFVDEYLADGGPLTMLEEGGRAGDFHDRPMFPERLPVVALSIDVTARLLEVLEEFFTQSSVEVGSWPGTGDPSTAPQTRRRLEAIRERGRRLET